MATHEEHDQRHYLDLQNLDAILDLVHQAWTTLPQGRSARTGRRPPGFNESVEETRDYLAQALESIRDAIAALGHFIRIHPPYKGQPPQGEKP